MSIKNTKREIIMKLAKKFEKKAGARIDHGTDGPITAFVLISRAMKNVKSGTDVETMSNELYEKLKEYGYLNDSRDDEGRNYAINSADGHPNDYEHEDDSPKSEDWSRFDHRLPGND